MWCNHSQYPPTGKQRECPSAGAPGNWGGKTGLPSLCGGLQDGHRSLHTRELVGTCVPPTAPDQWCATSCPLLECQLPCPVLQAMVDGELTPTAPIPRVPEIPVSPTGTKHQHHSLDQDVPAPRQEEEETVEPNYTPKKCPHWQTEGGKACAAKALKEPHHKAFSKELVVVRMARSNLLRDALTQHWAGGVRMTSPACFNKWLPPLNLLGTDIHEVQEDLGWQEETPSWQLAHQVLFQGHSLLWDHSSPTKLLKIMGLEGIHLHQRPWQWQSSLTLCLWCGKEGQNEGMVVNHL